LDPNLSNLEVNKSLGSTFKSNTINNVACKEFNAASSTNLRKRNLSNLRSKMTRPATGQNYSKRSEILKKVTNFSSNQTVVSHNTSKVKCLYDIDRQATATGMINVRVKRQKDFSELGNRNSGWHDKGLE
jgi:hypothetical protein